MYTLISRAIVCRLSRGCLTNTSSVEEITLTNSRRSNRCGTHVTASDVDETLRPDPREQNHDCASDVAGVKEISLSKCVFRFSVQL
jgi:hypothetical protein